MENCQAHNLKVVGSNPTPETKNTNNSVFYKDAILRGCVFLRMAQCLDGNFPGLAENATISAGELEAFLVALDR